MGRSFKITGKVYGNVKKAGDIGVVSDSTELALNLDWDIFPGYFPGKDVFHESIIQRDKGRNMNRLKVLAIDDEPDFCELLVKRLTAGKMNAEGTGDGAGALEILKNNDILIK